MSLRQIPAGGRDSGEVRARYKGKCEVCLGLILPGQSIERCPGVHGTWQHSQPADCRYAYRSAQEVWLAEALRMGQMSDADVARVLARDDAATKFPDA